AFHTTCVNIIDKAPKPTYQISEDEIEDFISKVPEIGEELEEFLLNLNYRKLDEIIDENLFHELATSYFRDLLFNKKDNTSDIDIEVSFLRHRTLNWVRIFMGIKEWHETDTST
ncbi:MAG: DUF4272 domain-containing protein, partial [Saprospiraceae bacterium]|nr:DUF4272 domain-containing protein [Saprospiraceae bacterium]